MKATGLRKRLTGLERTTALGLTAVVLCLAGTPTRLAVNASGAPELSRVRDVVAQNFAKVNDLQLTVRVYLPIMTEQSLAEPKADQHVWAFKGKRQYWSSTGMWPLGTVPPPPNQVRAFDGEVLRTVVFEKNDRSRQAQGGLLPAEAAQEYISRQAADLTGCLSAWGWHIQGRSLTEWLNSDTAHISGTARVGEHDCLIIEVAHRLGQRERLLRCFLAKELGFALVRYESESDGRKRMTVTNTELREALPGVWFPFAGTLDPEGAVTDQGYVLQPWSFEVLEVHANTDIPDRLFKLEFTPGIPVVDMRFEQPVPMVWGQGLDVRDEDWTARLGEQVESKGTVPPDGAGGHAEAHAARMPTSRSEAPVRVRRIGLRTVAGISSVFFAAALLVLALARRLLKRRMTPPSSE